MDKGFYLDKKKLWREVNKTSHEYKQLQKQKMQKMLREYEEERKKLREHQYGSSASSVESRMSGLRQYVAKRTKFVEE